MGIQLINILEKIHAAGLVYNDLNLDNILLDYGVRSNEDIDCDIFDQVKINLIDMSFATPFLDENRKQHVRKKTLDKYRGSIYFSSVN